MKKNYTAFHVHSDRSLLDSCTHFKDYIDKAKELGMTAIAFSEHANIYNWIEKKMHCDEMGLKYIHGCEVYLTETFDEKIRDNMHTILISKNTDGFKELNLLIDKSTQEDHVYYKNRISFDEFLNISDNIIKISACLASPLNKLSEENPYYEKLLKHYDYYEIQYHNDSKGEQRDYNLKLYKYSKKYNKPLIVGTDTHSINKYKAECRSILKKAKKMSYEGEDEFDLTFKSYDEVVEMFKIQNSLPIDIVLEALENTNKMAESCENITLDTNIKYPKQSDNDDEFFVDQIRKNFRDKIKRGLCENIPEYTNQIIEEIRVFKKLNMSSFMLSMWDICRFCEENGIPRGNCRGSAGGSLVAYILDIIDVNPIKWKTVFSRFANEDRLEVGDIDVDFSPTQREDVYNYIINKFTYDRSSYILAIGTISDKGTIDDIGRALSDTWIEQNNKAKKLKDEYDEALSKEESDYGKWAIENSLGSKFHDLIRSKENPYSLSNVANIKKEYEENPEKAKKKYKELFYYFDGLLGTAISQSIHPAGILASPITIPDNYGTFWSKGKRISQINMEEVHECGLVKYDILGLKNVEIIKDCCKLIGIEYPKSHELNWNDKEVWNHITDSPVGIFQFESKFAFDCMKKYKPKAVNDLAMLSAIIRPGATSIRDRFLDREINVNPDIIIDELLKDNGGWLIFQEDTNAFLQQICGLSGSDSDNIRRAIGRKQRERLEEALPSILEGYCSKSSKSREIAEKEAKEFIQILEDSANYQFGKNHSTGYSMVSYMCGYFRHYYPIEFITSYLNNANNDDDIKAGTELCGQYNITIKSPKWGRSKGKYFPSKEDNSVYKGISSIKFLNENVADELYDLSKKKEYNNFIELLIDMQQTSINSRQLEILIKLDFFDVFGKSQKLLSIYNYFQLLHGKKSFKKSTLETKAPELLYMIPKYSTETPATYKNLDSESMLKEVITTMPDKSIPIKDLLSFQLEVLGYIDYKNPDLDKKYVLVTGLNTKYSPIISTMSLGSGKSVDCKCTKKLLSERPVKQGDIIYISKMSKKDKMKKVGEDEKGKAKFEKVLGEFWWHIDNYLVIKNLDEVLEG